MRASKFSGACCRAVPRAQEGVLHNMGAAAAFPAAIFRNVGAHHASGAGFLANAIVVSWPISSCRFPRDEGLSASAANSVAFSSRYLATDLRSLLLNNGLAALRSPARRVPERPTCCNLANFIRTHVRISCNACNSRGECHTPSPLAHTFPPPRAIPYRQRRPALLIHHRIPAMPAAGKHADFPGIQNNPALGAGLGIGGHRQTGFLVHPASVNRA